jgi:hypothetical protein
MEDPMSASESESAAESHFTSSSRLIPVNELSLIIEGKKELTDILEKLDLDAEVDRPPVVRVRCNIPDGSTFDVRSLLGGLREKQEKNFDWHVLRLVESRPDPVVRAERTVYESVLRDFRDMAEASAATFGRNRANDWVFPNAHISRRHGMVYLDDQLEVWVLDGRRADPSTNGLYYMDAGSPIDRIQRLAGPLEYVSFGPQISFHDGRRSHLFRIRMERVQAGD